MAHLPKAEGQTLKEEALTVDARASSGSCKGELMMVRENHHHCLITTRRVLIYKCRMRKSPDRRMPGLALHVKKGTGA